jgi:ATP-binding cassette subfamily B protein
MLQEELPREITRELDARGLNGVPVLLSTKSDLTVQGDQRRHWLVANAHYVAIVADGPRPTVVNSLRVQDVERFRAHSEVGSGFLQAYVDKAWVNLTRYSSGLSPRFHKVARKLEQLREHGEVTVDPEETVDRSRCVRCNWKLPAGDEPCPRCVPRKAIAARLAQMLRPQWRGALAMFALMLAGVAAELAPPKLQQYLVDHILSSGQGTPVASELMGALLMVVLALAGTRLLLGVVAYFKGQLSSRVGAALTHRLRTDLVAKLHGLGVGYYDRHQVGSLTSRVVHDSEVLHSLLQQVTGGFLLQIVQVIGVGVMLFTLNPKLGAFMLIPTPLVIGGSWFFWRRVYPRYYRYWDSSSKQAGTLSGMLAGIRVVKAFAQESREYERFARASDTLRTTRIDVEKSGAAFSAVMQIVFSLGALIVWYVGGRDVLAGQMTLGSLMAFLAYVAMFYAPLATLSQLTTWLTSFMTGCHRVFELLDMPIETREPAVPKALHDPQGRIRFEAVTFGYESHHPVLRQVDFEIEPGQTIGIVGRSGSGKTTIVNLICRFYDVNEGRVLIDGVDVRELSARELRRQVGVVLQEPFLFRGTIWENLVYGEPGVRREAAIRAAKAAQAHDFILRKPLGYDTWLGERGAGLSGGERQRLSIARALLYDPKILILDEATSSVDTESEKSIQEALRVLAKGRTTIAIAHRLTTLRDADRILVFDEGKLIEQGSHAELMEQGGQYARLVQIQMQLSSHDPLDVARPRLSNGASVGTNEPRRDSPSSHELADYEPQWFDPLSTEFGRDAFGGLTVRLAEGTSHRGLFAVRLFPATEPDGYISLRTWDQEGHELELGMIRDLREWPEAAQSLLREALARRYLMRPVEGIDAIRQEFGHLLIDLRTAEGPRCIVLRWDRSQVHDFGDHGKILIDVDDDRYLIRDVERFPQRERELFQRHIYW